MGWRRSPKKDWSLIQCVEFFREIYTRFKFGSVTWDPPNVGAGAEVSTALDAATYPALTGLRSGSFVVAMPTGGITAGLYVREVTVSADDELTIVLRNETGGAINESSGTWAFFSVIL